MHNSVGSDTYNTLQYPQAICIEGAAWNRTDKPDASPKHYDTYLTRPPGRQAGMWTIFIRSDQYTELRTDSNQKDNPMPKWKEMMNAGGPITTRPVTRAHASAVITTEQIPIFMEGAECIKWEHVAAEGTAIGYKPTKEMIDKHPYLEGLFLICKAGESEYSNPRFGSGKRNANVKQSLFQRLQQVLVKLQNAQPVSWAQQHLGTHTRYDTFVFSFVKLVSNARQYHECM